MIDIVSAPRFSAFVTGRDATFAAAMTMDVSIVSRTPFTMAVLVPVGWDVDDALLCAVESRATDFAEASDGE